jgi:hypothetical protein
MTIFDFFSYFISGIIFNSCFVLVIYFTNSEGIKFFRDLSFHDVFGKGLPLLTSNWLFILTIILVTYVFGVILSTLSPILIEWPMMKFSFLKKHIYEKFIFPKDLCKLVEKKVKTDFDFDINFDIYSEKNRFLIITFVEKNFSNAYNTAFVFWVMYALNRNLCMIFFLVGLATLIMNIIQCNDILFAIILIVFSIFTFLGYIKFYKYFLAQILSAYINSSKN